jgi:hypothetical protein
MTLEEKKEEYLKKPLMVGDKVYVRGLGTQNKKSWGNLSEVKSIDEDGNIEIDVYGHRIVMKDHYKKYLGDVGINPIVQKPWNSSLKMVNFSLDSIVYGLGYDRRDGKYINEGFKEVNWSPTIINSDGDEVGYQRDFVWTLEQKQSLIHSIYNNIDIGKVVIRKRSYSWVKNRVSEGKIGAFKDIVDGKQRLNAILDFINNKFSDKDGHYYSDFSEIAKSQFFNFNSIGYGELGESASDKDVKSVFLGINFTGTPVSEEHIEFVKSIKI